MFGDPFAPPKKRETSNSHFGGSMFGPAAKRKKSNNPFGLGF